MADPRARPGWKQIGLGGLGIDTPTEGVNPSTFGELELPIVTPELQAPPPSGILEGYAPQEQEKSETRQRRDVLAQVGATGYVLDIGGPAPQPVLLTLTERHAIPRIVKASSEIALLPIDHRAGFLLAHMDGIHTMEEILDICAMPPEEALALIRELEALGVIRID